MSRRWRHFIKESLQILHKNASRVGFRGVILKRNMGDKAVWVPFSLHPIKTLLSFINIGYPALGPTWETVAENVVGFLFRPPTGSLIGFAGSC